MHIKVVMAIQNVILFLISGCLCQNVEELFKEILYRNLFVSFPIVPAICNDVNSISVGCG